MNHVIDPTFFYDAIEEFAFNYQIDVFTSRSIDASGKEVCTYTTSIIRGSLQRDMFSIQRSDKGNTSNGSCRFYCKSKYRINVNDFLHDRDCLYIVTAVQNYDEYGVREAVLRLCTLTEKKRFLEYSNFISGREIV